MTHVPIINYFQYEKIVFLIGSDILNIVFVERSN